MKLFGLEGSGFLISVCLTLFLAGMIMFYVRQALADQSAKMQSIMSIVQQINANNMQVPIGGGNAMFHPPNVNLEMQNPNKLDTINEETKSDLLSNSAEYSEENEKIDVSDDEEDEEDEDDTDDEDEDDDTDDEVHTEKEEAVVELNNNIEEVLDLNTTNSETIKEISLDNTTMLVEESIPSTTTQITLNNNLLNMSDSDKDSDDEDSDDEDSDDDVKEPSEVKNLTIADDENLDNMLLNMINAHNNSNLEEKQKELSKDIHIVELNDNKETNDNLQNLKVAELRQLVKDKNIKVSNISKLKKNECIELLS